MSTQKRWILVLGRSALGPRGLRRGLADGPRLRPRLGRRPSIRSAPAPTATSSRSGQDDRAANQVLALDVTPPGGPLQRLLVPGTAGSGAESLPSVVFEDDSQTVFLLWESRGEHPPAPQARRLRRHNWSKAIRSPAIPSRRRPRRSSRSPATPSRRRRDGTGTAVDAPPHHPPSDLAGAERGAAARDLLHARSSSSTAPTSAGIRSTTSTTSCPPRHRRGRQPRPRPRSSARRSSRRAGRADRRRGLRLRRRGRWRRSRSTSCREQLERAGGEGPLPHRRSRQAARLSRPTSGYLAAKAPLAHRRHRRRLPPGDRLRRSADQVSARSWRGAQGPTCRSLAEKARSHIIDIGAKLSGCGLRSPRIGADLGQRSSRSATRPAAAAGATVVVPVPVPVPRRLEPAGAPRRSGRRQAVRPRRPART